MLWPISNKNIIKKNLQPHNIKLIINFHINIKKGRKIQSNIGSRHCKFFQFRPNTGGRPLTRKILQNKY